MPIDPGFHPDTPSSSYLHQEADRILSNDSSERLRRAVEATRLNFGITADDVIRLAESSQRLGVQGVCVPTVYVPVLQDAWTSSGRHPDIVTVANFPIGDQPLDIVLAQIDAAVAAGANHIDVVLPGSMMVERDWRGIESFLRSVCARAKDEFDRACAIKVILETAAFDEGRIRSAAGAAIDGGARWLKTSTGFHPAGGATPRAVAMLRDIAPAGVGVKASGGIRTREAALTMLDAGADRIGTSSEAVILASG